MRDFDETDAFAEPNAPEEQEHERSETERRLLDPSAQPTGPSAARSLPKAPNIIFGAAAILFVGGIAYESDRSAEDEDRKEVVSAVEAAKDVTGMGGPKRAHAQSASSMAGASALASAAPALDQQSGHPQPSDAAGGTGDHAAAQRPPIPEPPTFELAPPRGARDSATDGRATAQGEGGSPAETAPDSASEGDQALAGRAAEAQRDEEFEAMRREMFRRALTNSTVVKAGVSHASAGVSPGTPGDRDLRRSTSVHGGSSYADKIRALQQAGLVPNGAAVERASAVAGGAVPPQGRGGYAAFEAPTNGDRWALGNDVEAPTTPYLIRAGDVIPATLQTGVNSDLPGQITAIVARDVRDTATGHHVLIPQGSKLVGSYQSDVKMGQERLLVAWQRVTWPDGKVLDIGAMPGTDVAGAAGLTDQVNNHFWRLFGSALLMSGITAGVSVSQGQFGSGATGNQTVGGVLAQSLGQQLGQVTEEMIRRQMNVAPTLEIRPGYRLNVSVTKDLAFSGPYRAFDYRGGVRSGTQTLTFTRGR